MDETNPTTPQGDNDGQNSDSSEFRQDIVDLGSSTIRTARGSIHTLTIVGQIEGHQELPPNAKATKYEHVLPLLAAVEDCRRWKRAVDES